ncbi:hypothetical protein CVT25_005444 [Psilocybe cyanescens]|uniref:F-box domain-containing protein n=1 Tax=Psilocybe cyanescens TaxID=93625 RepID=A0A409XC08_PSICY|nr:hypothetical protein CVT25_005444 [Psilocybe cyanescens]
MFIPLPTSDVCDPSSRDSLKIAQTVSRTWYNLDHTLWSTIPERITLHPDGKGEISCPYSIFTQSKEKTEVLRHSFKWKLARDGPLGMEGMDVDGLLDVIPKLIRSDYAWTLTPWTAGYVVPAYLHLSHINTSVSVNENSPFIFDPFTFDAFSVGSLPLELVEHIFLLASDEATAAGELLSVCRRSRELVMRRRRRNKFSTLVERFIEYGMAMWINYGHFDPKSTDESSPDVFYGLKALLFKFPPVCGYAPVVGHELEWGQSQCWSSSENSSCIYHACQLPLRGNRLPTFWRMLHGDSRYDAHPEIEKEWA